MRGARHERRQSHREPPSTLGVQTVHVFVRAYPGEQGPRVQVVRQRKLYKKSGDGLVLVEALDDRLDLLLGGVLGEAVGLCLHTDLGAVGLFVAHVGDRGRILPHQDHVQAHRPAP